MKENKFFVLPFLVVILVSLIFLVAQIPTAKVEPKNLPIAFVNEDLSENAEALAKKVLENDTEAIQFVEYSSVTDMIEGMNNRESYGGFVIPKTFTENLASIQTNNPTKATIQIYLNEGYNATVATTVETILQKMTNQLSIMMSGQMLNQMTEATTQLKIQYADNPQLASTISLVQPEMVQLLANPIQTETIKVNPTKDLASVPMGLFTSVWISSLLGAILFYLGGNKRTFKNRKEQTIFQVVQSLLPILYSLFAGYLITWLSTWILDYKFDSFHSVALLLSIALLSFVYLIFACLSWFKMIVIPIFAILMFFGLPLIQMAPEMIPDFYREFVLPWLPMRFLVDGLKDLLFFGENIINSYTVVLVWIAVISLVCIWVKNLLLKPKETN